MMAYITMYVAVWCFAIDIVYGLLQYGIMIVWPFMHFYNGTRGKWKGMKWFFYFFYVGHLVLMGMLRILLHGNIMTITGNVLQYHVLQYKQHSQNIHQNTDLLFSCLSGRNIQYNVRDNTHGDTFGDAVHEWHGNDRDKAGNCLCVVRKINLRDGGQH